MEEMQLGVEEESLEGIDYFVTLQHMSKQKIEMVDLVQRGDFQNHQKVFPKEVFDWWWGQMMG